MPKPIAHTSGICFAMPDILNTPSPSGTVPLPYPNTAQLADAQGAATSVNAGGKAVILKSSSIPGSSGGEPATAQPFNGATAACEFTSASGSVFANGSEIVRMGDSTDQNNGNCQGQVMAGLTTVLVGD